jgi:thiamine kinase-like enzyme
MCARMEHVIHFTDTFVKLCSILDTASLRLHYCEEVFSLGNENISSAAHPMVSFSKYRTKELQRKTITYGKYGIAFTSEWVTRNELHPVLYLDKDSKVAKALAKLLKSRRENANLPSKTKLEKASHIVF